MPMPAAAGAPCRGTPHPTQNGQEGEQAAYGTCRQGVVIHVACRDKAMVARSSRSIAKALHDMSSVSPGKCSIALTDSCQCSRLASHDLILFASAPDVNSSSETRVNALMSGSWQGVCFSFLAGFLLETNWMLDESCMN